MLVFILIFTARTSLGSFELELLEEDEVEELKSIKKTWLI